MEIATLNSLDETDGCANALPEFFQFVEIEISTACNLRCRYCPNSVSDRGLMKNNRQMPTALFQRLIDELAEIGFAGEFHPHLYNEPLLDKRLPQLLQYVRHKLKDCQIVLFTNGLYLTLEKYLELESVGVNKICATRHLPTDPPHIREIIQFTKTRRQNDLKIEYHQDGIQGQINFNRCGIIPLKRVINKTKACVWPYHFLTINYKGDVLLCCNDNYATFPVGNVVNCSIMDVWNKIYNKSLRKCISNDASIVSLCRKCMIGII
jgi:MoaA/NifB/PqqE/SkfB family radical SAM enzyme